MYGTLTAAAETVQWLVETQTRSARWVDKKTNYLSNRLFLQVRPGATGNGHIVLDRRTSILSNGLYTSYWQGVWDEVKTHWFRLEFIQSSFHFLQVGKLGGSISICHKDELPSGTHRSLSVWHKHTVKSPTHARTHTLYSALLSHHPHSSSFTPVLHQCQDSHFICTILPAIPQSNLVAHRETDGVEGTLAVRSMTPERHY